MSNPYNILARALVPPTLDEMFERQRAAPHFIVEIVEDDARFNLKVGEKYEATVYTFDPSDKYTLVKRIPDGWEPGCNVYKHQARRVKQ